MTDLAWMVTKIIPIYNQQSSVPNPPVTIQEVEDNNLVIKLAPNEVAENELMPRSYDDIEFEMANPLMGNEEERNEDAPEVRSLCGGTESSGCEDDD